MELSVSSAHVGRRGHWSRYPVDGAYPLRGGVHVACDKDSGMLVKDKAVHGSGM
jgi:hypothetical protein